MVYGDESLDVVYFGPENHPLLDNTSKAGVRWFRMAENSYTRVRIGADFVSNHGPVNTARIQLIHENTALSALRLFIDDNIIKTIVHWSNTEASSQNYDLAFNAEEFLRFIAVLYCRGVFSRGCPLKKLWSKLYGMQIVKDLMPRDRFVSIMKYLRFDNKAHRRRIVETDKFVHVRAFRCELCCMVQTRKAFDG